MEKGRRLPFHAEAQVLLLTQLSTRRRKSTGPCGWNPAEDAFMRRGARTGDGVRRILASQQLAPCQPVGSGDVAIELGVAGAIDLAHASFA